MMSLKIRFFFFVMIFFGVQSECMEMCVTNTNEQQLLRFTPDILSNVIMPYLSLQSIARFGRTCKTYQHIFEPGKIQHKIPGLIVGQLRTAIMNRWNKVIGKIIQNKKYNIFELFDNETVETAFQALCSMKDYYIESKNILALLPGEDGEQKNKAVQYLAKYDALNNLMNLLHKGYLDASKEYGNKCTLLHYAAVRGCRALTDELLKKGADVHAVNQWGRQPFEYACMFEEEHKGFDHIYLWRGRGVVEWLSDWCGKKHFRTQKWTEKCHAARQPWDISQEEANWLRNSCTYSLEKFNLL